MRKLKDVEGVYIEGMKIPRNCTLCPLCEGEYGREYIEKTYCMAKGRIVCNASRRPKSCPLISVNLYRKMKVIEAQNNYIFDLENEIESMDMELEGK